MRARHVNEEGFTRGGDPYGKLGVGSHRPIRAGDRFRTESPLYLDRLKQNGTYTTRYDRDRNFLVMFKGDVFKVSDTSVLAHRDREHTIYVVMDPTTRNRSHARNAWFRADWFRDNRELFTQLM